MPSLFVHGNLVHDFPLAQIFEGPKQVLWRDSKHRRANAHAGIERDHFAVFQFLSEAIYEVNFGAHRPFRSGVSGHNGLADAFGRADLVGSLRHLETAFGMNDDANAGLFASDRVDVLGAEALMDRAVALPENDLRLREGLRAVPAEFLERVPDNHLVEWNSHAVAGVAPEMLIRQKEDLLAALKSPFHDLGRVGACANRAAMLAGEGLDGGSGVHVGDGNDLGGVENASELPRSEERR